MMNANYFETHEPYCNKVNLKPSQYLLKYIAHDENRIVIYWAQISNIVICWPLRENITTNVSLHFISFHYSKVSL